MSEEIMDSMLTTVDNPYDPFDEWQKWYNYDRQLGYNTCQYLARIALVSPDLPEEIEDEIIEKAMDEIIDMHNGELYKKVQRPRK